MVILRIKWLHKFGDIENLTSSYKRRLHGSQLKWTSCEEHSQDQQKQAAKGQKEYPKLALSCPRCHTSIRRIVSYRITLKISRKLNGFSVPQHAVSLKIGQTWWLLQARSQHPLRNFSA